MGNNNKKPTVNASQLCFIPERGQGKAFDGKADVNRDIDVDDARSYEYVVLQAGDCNRDGIMPTPQQIAIMKHNKDRRDSLNGRNNRNAMEK